MAVQDNPVMALRIYLHQLPCPTCSRHELIPMLQCDHYPDGCLWLILCETWLTQYHIDHRSLSNWSEEKRLRLRRRKRLASTPDQREENPLFESMMRCPQAS